MKWGGWETLGQLNLLPVGGEFRIFAAMKKINRSLLILILCMPAVQRIHAQKFFTGKPQYQIKTMRSDTVLGTIVVELFPAIAPLAVENFDSLVGIHFFDSIAFHRVIPGFMIQGGDPNSRSGDKSTWGYGDPGQATVNAEFSAVSHQRGILSAARATDINSATSQFFICVADDRQLDKKYSVYGRAVSGMAIADKIVNAPRDANDDPLDKISMFVNYVGSNDSLTPTPLLVSPASGTTSPLTLQTLKWQSVPSAMLYNLQVATDANFASVIIDTQINQLNVTAKVKTPTGKTYYWRVGANNGGNPSAFSEPWSLTVGTASVTGDANNSIALGNCFPNPTSGATMIPFELPRVETVSIRVFDGLGRVAAEVADGRRFSAGQNMCEIPGGLLFPGAYTIELNTNEGSLHRPLIIR